MLSCYTFTMNSFVAAARERALSFAQLLGSFIVATWRKYRTLRPRWQAVIAVALFVFLLSFNALLGLIFKAEDAGSPPPYVTLASVGELSGTGDGASLIGSVRSVSEADIRAESGGKVTRVNAALGGYVGAGAVIAELENAAQRAAVLQAEGAYESALASREGSSPQDISTSARNTYRSSYSTLDSTLSTYIDGNFFGDYGPQGPQYLIAPTPFVSSYFSIKRSALEASMNSWRAHLATADAADTQQLLAEAEAVTRQAESLVSDMAVSATRTGTDASSAQLSALSTARTSIASLVASINSAKVANRSQSTSATLGADASVKTALGTLRGAQAALEKTRIRTPIAGTVNFLPIRTGDYVGSLDHVATVAQNGALEIVAYVSESTRQSLTVGQKVTVEDKYQGVITSIAPALDPTRKQIEVHVGVTEAGELVNGQSVRIQALGGTPAVQTNKPAAPKGPLMLPLASVKLTSSARVVFSLDGEGRLVAHPVEIGDVRGDRIEILTELPSDLRIVTDARGLAQGQKVQEAPAQ